MSKITDMLAKINFAKSKPTDKAKEKNDESPSQPTTRVPANFAGGDHQKDQLIFNFGLVLLVLAGLGTIIVIIYMTMPHF